MFLTLCVLSSSEVNNLPEENAGDRLVGPLLVFFILYRFLRLGYPPSEPTMGGYVIDSSNWRFVDTDNSNTAYTYLGWPACVQESQCESEPREGHCLGGRVTEM